MGTNFYLFSKDKQRVKDTFRWNEFSLTDEPDFGYEVHIAKTSIGWLPLFQGHEKIRSVQELKRLYEGGGFTILDEYGEEYSWEGFADRVLAHGLRQEQPRTHDTIDYGGREFFIDDEGYEFVCCDFS